MLRSCLLFICALSVAVLANENEIFETPYNVESLLEEHLQNLSDYLQQHDQSFVKEVNLTIDESYFKVRLDASSLVTKGLSTFKATEKKITVSSPDGINVKLSFKLHDVLLEISRYYFRFEILFIPFYGDGTFSMKIKELLVESETTIIISPSGKVTVGNIKLYFSFLGTRFDIEGLLYNEPFSILVSNGVSECFPEFVELHKEHFGAVLGKVLYDMINRFLNPGGNQAEVQSGFTYVGPYILNYNYKV